MIIFTMGLYPDPILFSDPFKQIILDPCRSGWHHNMVIKLKHVEDFEE
jgi:hypothetical protein